MPSTDAADAPVVNTSANNAAKSHLIVSLPREPNGRDYTHGREEDVFLRVVRGMRRRLRRERATGRFAIRADLHRCPSRSRQSRVRPELRELSRQPGRWGAVWM